MKKKKGILSTIILVLVILVGLSVMLYPIVSSWWNSKVQSKLVAQYDEQISKIDESRFEEFFNNAYEYNRQLANIHSPLTEYDKVKGYDDTLDVTGTGIMGYVTIPQINVELPIYHGTSEGVLNIAVGHLQGSSLPVGGLGTHAVISAHRGLPSATLFSDLDKMAIGDVFTVTVLNEVLSYKVDEINVVLPYEMEKLAIDKNNDYVTLMTCTPYGVNSHRLLVRGVRIPNEEAEKILRVSADAQKVDNMIVMPFMAFPLFLILVFVWAFGGKKKTRTEFDYDLEFNDK
ncbi:MAG: class C sortase [Oscillospiraceae bacterium]|nr:class C sortase [Oscillospiraceae bacterium]MBQ8883518.1 class C sortase [Oscillospiraceae bacterium]